MKPSARLIVPTLMVVALVPVMLLLGFWQLDRAEEKQLLLDLLNENSRYPVADLPLSIEPEALFRRFGVQCDGLRGPPKIIGGAGPGAAQGYRQVYLCARPGDDVLIDVGWSRHPRPDGVTLDRAEFFGPLVPAPGRGLDLEDGADTASTPRVMLVAEQAVSGLQPSRPPTTEAIPDNHLAYAVQWFLFAATLLIMYVLYIRRLRASQ